MSDTSADNYRYRTLAGKSLDDSDLQTCLKILAEEPAVNLQMAEEHLPNSNWVCLTLHKREIVGLGAIKGKRQEYARSVSRKSGHVFPDDMLELGYVAVSTNHRGNHISPRLVGELLAQYADPLFSTTFNDKMISVLESFGFLRKGQDWPSHESPGSLLSLWIKP